MVKMSICLTPSAEEAPIDLCQKHRNEAAVAALQAIAAKHGRALLSRQQLQDMADGIREEGKKEREAAQQKQTAEAAKTQAAASTAGPTDRGKS
jgi:uncharacterized membrane protein YqiK